jgi:hypothetical protein
LAVYVFYYIEDVANYGVEAKNKLANCSGLPHNRLEATRDDPDYPNLHYQTKPRDGEHIAAVARAYFRTTIYFINTINIILILTFCSKPITDFLWQKTMQQKFANDLQTR